MGWKFEVLAWEEYGDKGDRTFVHKYSGDSLISAIRHMLDAKKSGIGCIKLIWRP